jgi:hypothetical protein
MPQHHFSHIHIDLVGPLQSTAGAVSITTAPYAAVFGELKFFFQLYSFFAVNLKQIYNRNKKKKFEKKCLTG